MKKFILPLLSLLVFAPLGVHAQAGMTLRTAKIIEQQQSKQANPLLRSASVAEQEVSVLLSTNQNLNIQDIEQTGAQVGTHLNGVVTLRATPSQLSQIAQLRGVDFISANNRVFPKLDTALPVVKADSVQLGLGGLPQAYTGKDVIVGVVDFGFNYTHPTFYDTAGNLRIARVWNQSESRGTSCVFKYGSVYTTADLIAKQKECSASDESHGTHVAGIAAGGGGKVKAYKGVAPDANIVMVQLDNGYESEIVDALSYIFSYAQSVGKPAVVNLSIGYHYGPHDGTSSMDKAIDQLSGEGRIIVGAAGNEGDIKLHAAHRFTSDTDTMRTVIGVSSQKEASAAAWAEMGNDVSWNVEVWENNKLKDRISTQFYSTKTINRPSKKFPYGKDTVSVEADGGYYYYNGNEQEARAIIQLDVRNTNSVKYSVVLAIRGVANKQVHLWNLGDDDGNKAEFKALKLGSSWVDGDTEYTVGELGGTAKKIICVGAYTTKKYWLSMGDGPYENPNETVGNVATFSSLGPTADGRAKPDLVAPGSLLVSSVNSCDNSYNRFNIDVVAKESTGSFYYAVMQGTSMAAPMVTGAVALLLQECPTLTPDSVRSILQRTALLNATLAALPQNTRGAGLLDVLKAMKANQGKACGTVAVKSFDNECTATTSVASNLWSEAKNQLEFSVTPNPNSGTFYIKAEEDGAFTLKVYNLGGTLLHSEQAQSEGEVSLRYLPQGVYLVQLSKDGRQGVKKMLIQR